MRGDAFQNFRAWAPNTVRIRKVLEQTATQSCQDALFVSLGICFCVQVCLPLTSVGLLSSRLFQRLHDALTDLLQPVVELHLGLLLGDSEPSGDCLP